jgi:hypothetical protein
MMASRPTSRHPSTGELVRRLDGELDERAEARLTEHLERCDDCRSRVAQLTDRSREAARLLRGIAPDDLMLARQREVARVAVRAAAARRKSLVRARRGWAAAAATAALVVVSLSVDPLRAWVMQRLDPGGPGSDAAGSPVASLPSAVVGREGSVIAFQPAGPVFQLSVERTQPSGELLLQVRAVGQATAQVTNGGAETMLVLPSGLRIENSAASAASYRVTLPASVEQVVVRVADAAPRVISVGGADLVERIPLQRR